MCVNYELEAKLRKPFIPSKFWSQIAILVFGSSFLFFGCANKFVGTWQGKEEAQRDFLGRLVRPAQTTLVRIEKSDDGFVWAERGQKFKAKMDGQMLVVYGDNKVYVDYIDQLDQLQIKNVFTGSKVSYVRLRAPVENTDVGNTKTENAESEGSQKRFHPIVKVLVLRAQPSRTAPALGNLSNSSEVTIVETTDHRESIDGKSGAWVKIRAADGREGYVFGGFLQASRE